MKLDINQMTREKRDNIFNVRTNTLLGEINQRLVDENKGEFPPRYTKVKTKPSHTTIAKWQKQIEALEIFFSQDSQLGYIIYKLFLCRALVNYLNGDKEESLKFFNSAMSFEQFDIVLYYSEVLASVGGKVPKASKYEKRPHNSYEFERKMLNNKGKIPFYKHLTIGLPYALESHYSEWTEEEIDRYVFLRAIEWLAFPAFVLIGLGAPLLLVIRPIPLIICVAIVNYVWSLIATRYVSLSVSQTGVFLHQLKWLTAPLTALVFLLHHEYRIMFVALLWPLIGMLLSLIRVNDKNGSIAYRLRQQIFLKIR